MFAHICKYLVYITLTLQDSIGKTLALEIFLLLFSFVDKLSLPNLKNSNVKKSCMILMMWQIAITTYKQCDTVILVPFELTDYLA